MWLELTSASRAIGLLQWLSESIEGQILLRGATLLLARHGVMKDDWVSEWQTASCHVVEAVRLRAHHYLKADDRETVHVSLLSAAGRREVLSQYLRRRPQLTYSDNNLNIIPLTRWPRQRLDGRSTAYQRSLRSRRRSTSVAADPLAAVSPIYLFM